MDIKQMTPGSPKRVKDRIYRATRTGLTACGLHNAMSIVSLLAILSWHISACDPTLLATCCASEPALAKLGMAALFVGLGGLLLVAV
jgi:hypothetical protein